MSVTEIDEGDLVPLSAKVVEWVYGNAEYVGSVFGTTNPTRRQLQDYYENAKTAWHRIPFQYLDRNLAVAWLRQNGVKGLDYYFPLGQRHIWFRDQQDAFAFCLKFGIIDNKSGI